MIAKRSELPPFACTSSADVIQFIDVFRRPGFRAWDPDRKPHPEAPEVAAFRRVVDAAGLIRQFDWPEWARTDGVRYRAPEALSNASLETLARVFTVLVRGDRFDEGRLAGAIDAGFVGTLLARLQELVPAGKDQTAAD